VSRIGHPIDDPQLVDVRLATPRPADDPVYARARELAREHVRAVPTYWRDLVDGRLAIDRWPLRSCSGPWIHPRGPTGSP